MDRKVSVAIVDSEGIGQQSVPNAARMVKEAKVRMARDRARKAKSGKGKTDLWQGERQRQRLHARHLKGIAITVGNGHMEKDCFTKAKTKGKGKSAGSLDESEASVPENTSVGGRLSQSDIHSGQWFSSACSTQIPPVDFHRTIRTSAA